MALEETIRRVRERTEAGGVWWRHFPVRGSNTTEGERRALHEKMEKGERIASLGEEIRIRVVRDGVAYMVSARLKSVKRMTAPLNPTIRRTPEYGGVLR